MNFDFLPDDIFISISELKVDKLTEIRLRISNPALIFYNNKRYYLSTQFGFTDNLNNAVVCTKEHINYIINKELIYIKHIEQ